jgi:Flp pilus assembly pilin Flp
MSDFTTQAFAIFAGLIAVAIVAVLVSKNAQTSQVLNTIFTGFGKDVTAAVSPVSDGIGASSLGLNDLNPFGSQ